MADIEIITLDAGPLPPNAGKSGRDFPLWAAQEAVKAAEAIVVENDRSRDSLAKTATSVIGWSIPLSSLFIAASFSEKVDAPLRYGAAACAVCTLTAAYAAYPALKVRAWFAIGLHPDQWLPVISGETEANSELSILQERLNSLANAIDQNGRLLDGIKSRVNWAGRVFLATPIFGAITCFLTAPIGRRFVATIVNSIF